MKITLQKSEDQIKLLKAMVSKDHSVRDGARAAFAEFVAPIILEVIQQADLLSGIYRDLTFNQGDGASIPLDLYYNDSAGLVGIWSQSIAGGLATNQTSGVAELKLATYSIDTAISFLNKWVEQSRLDVVSKTLTRLANEILIRQNDIGWNVLFGAVATASTRSTAHIIRSNTTTVLILDDLSKLLTRSKRILASYNNGTPDPVRTKGLTDLYTSPEITEQVRAMAYQPMNTRSGAVTTSGATSIAAPESLREAVFANAGAASIYGIALHELNELGVGQTYNALFANYASGNYAKGDGSGGATFAAATEQILIGIDAARDSLVRPVQIDSETGGTMTMEQDDSFPARAKKFGYFCKIEEGRACIDNRAIQGLIV